MGRQPSSQNLPRPGTRQADLLQRINIEALEPRTLFSGGHDVLRGQMEAVLPAGPQLDVQFEQSFAAAELHAPHSLKLAQVMQGASSANEQSPFATPAFGVFARFTESRGDDSNLGIQSLGFATLPAVEIFYLRDGQPIALGAVKAAPGNGAQSADPGTDCTNEDVSTLIELAVPAQGDAGNVSSSVLRKLTGAAKDGTDPDSSQIPAGTFVATLLGPNGKPIPVLMQGRPDQSQGQSAASGSGTNQAPPPAPTQTPSITPASVPANPAPNGAVTPVTPLAMLPVSHGDHAVVTEAPAPKPLVVQTTPTVSSVSSASATISAPAESAAANHPLGMLAVAVPTILQVPHAIAAVSDAVQTAQGMVNVTGSVAEHASSLFSVILPSPSLPGTVAYSFIHLDAGGFNDAVTAFANELASLSTPTAATHSSLRAWEITAAVIGVDAIFFAWWYRKSRREREEQVAYLEDGFEPIPVPAK